MILTLDVGNSQIFGGVFREGELTMRFRKPSRPPTSSDELGLFLRGVLRENGTDPSGSRSRSRSVPSCPRSSTRCGAAAGSISGSIRSSCRREPRQG